MPIFPTSSVCPLTVTFSLVGVTVNVARTAEEAERQARGENVLATEAEQARAEAEAMFDNPNAGKGLDGDEGDAQHAQPFVGDHQETGREEHGEEGRQPAAAVAR